MTYEEALRYMQGLRRFGIKLGNQRFEELLRRLDNPHRVGYGIAHVAGTKGKGSTTAMIVSILRAHGFRVGGYFSPYVYDVRERVQVDEEMISRADFARLVTNILPHAEAIGATDLGPTTEFELKTAVGFCHFRDRHVDYAAVEVGLGGRLDATNVVSPDSTVITNIGLDHIHILGDTHALIAAEKAGIVKPGVPCVTAADHPDALDVIRRTARERCAPLRIATPAGFGGDVTWTTGGDTFAIDTAHGQYSELVSGLRGDFQRPNAACAVAAVEALASARGFEITEEAVRAGLARASLPGRFEILQDRPKVILDGAHNAMAAAALAQEIRKLKYDRMILVVGMLQGHEAEGMLAPFRTLAARVIATEPLWNKRQHASAIAAAAAEMGLPVEVVTPPAVALKRAVAQASPYDLVLVTGSFYTVGDTRNAAGETGEDSEHAGS